MTVRRRPRADPQLDSDAFGGHSLRTGFVTWAAERAARAERIMDRTGHHSHAMVRVYTRRANAFEGHAGEGLLQPTSLAGLLVVVELLVGQLGRFGKLLGRRSLRKLITKRNPQPSSQATAWLHRSRVFLDT